MTDELNGEMSSLRMPDNVADQFLKYTVQNGLQGRVKSLIHTGNRHIAA